MKKTLLFVGTMAMMASCTQEELIPNESAQNIAKGIVFEAAGESATRGEMSKDENGQYNFIWYAEQDRINVWASNVNTAGSNGKNTNPVLGVVESNFSNIATIDPAVYKATKSGSLGLFTAQDDKNWIAFSNDEKIRTIATYQANVTNVKAEAETVNGKSVTKKVTEITANAEISDEQDNPLNYVAAPMLSNTEGIREKGYNSVGEKMNLDLFRIYPVIAFSGVAGNDAFNADLGNLQQVILTNVEVVKPTDEHTKVPDVNLAGTGNFTVKYADNGTETYEFSKVGTAQSVIVTVGAKWTSDKRVYMAILPVDRTATKSDGSDPKQATQKMTIKYVYENASLEQNLETNKDWITPHKVIAAPALDIEKDYAYIVTEDIDKVTSGRQRKLIINKNNVKDAFINDSYIKWQSATSADVIVGSNTVKGIPVSEITEVEIRSNVNALTADDYAKLNKLTGVTKMVVKNATTTITYNALSALANLAELQMDNVTTIQYTNEVAKNTPVNTAKLATVKLPAYNFAASKEITTAILKPGVLTTLDMSGTISMKKIYPEDGMSLAGYAALTTVTVKDGVVLGPESFMGCTALKTINGYVTLGGYGAFEGCTSLKNISIDMAASTKIWDETFNGATSLENVYDKDGKTAIKPAIIGDKAFQGTKANIDLTATTSIGKSAFMNNTALKGTVFGSAGSTKYQLIVNATTVGESAFEGATALKYVNFTNLQTVSKSMMYGTTMNELKFAKVFTFAEGAGTKVFGTTSNTTLYVNPAQEYTANTISVNGSTIKFLTIIEE